VKSLPNNVTRQCRDCDLNPGPSAPESSTLTTRLPSHPRFYQIFQLKFSFRLTAIFRCVAHHCAADTAGRSASNWAMQGDHAGTVGRRYVATHQRIKVARVNYLVECRSRGVPPAAARSRNAPHLYATICRLL